MRTAASHGREMIASWPTLRTQLQKWVSIMASSIDRYKFHEIAITDPKLIHFSPRAHRSLGNFRRNPRRRNCIPKRHKIQRKQTFFPVACPDAQRPAVIEYLVHVNTFWEDVGDSINHRRQVRRTNSPPTANRSSSSSLGAKFCVAVANDRTSVPAAAIPGATTDPPATAGETIGIGSSC